ncbi:MAG TPA: cupin domain-containing protein [Edaphobacter sp.]
MSTAILDHVPEEAPEAPATAEASPRHLAVLGATIDIRATMEETEGNLSLIELTVPPHFPGAPRHYHDRTPESFFILEGSIEMLNGEKWSERHAGDFVYIAPGIIHAYRNTSDKPARFLVIAPGHDRFFIELIAWMKREQVWPPADRAELVEFGRRHDTMYI